MHGSLIEADLSANGLEQCGFATTVTTQQYRNATRICVKCGRLEDLTCAETPANAVGAQDRVHNARTLKNTSTAVSSKTTRIMTGKAALKRETPKFATRTSSPTTRASISTRVVTTATISNAPPAVICTVTPTG